MMRCLLSGICHNLFHIWGCKSPIRLVLRQTRKHFDNLKLVFDGSRKSCEVCGSKNVFGVKSQASIKAMLSFCFLLRDY